MDILQACDLKKTYGTGEACVHALDGVSLNVEKGEFVAIVGTSGSGKSTLLHMLGGLDRPSSGKVFVDGKDIFSLKDEELTIFRRRKRRHFCDLSVPSTIHFHFAIYRIGDNYVLSVFN